MYENNKIIGTKTTVEDLLIEDGKIIYIKTDKLPLDGLMNIH